MKVFLLGLFLSTSALAQTAIPPGTILPLELRSSLTDIEELSDFLGTRLLEGR